MEGARLKREAETCAVGVWRGLTSGDVTKACVAGLASFLAVKFLLKDVTMVFFSPFFTSRLRAAAELAVRGGSSTGVM